MYRKIIEQLKKRKISKNRKPLLLTGARQVGKTFLIKEFGKEFYKNTIYINFENTSNEINTLFEKELDPQKIITNLNIEFNENIIPGATLIIFDEIQANPRALTSLKYFHELANEYHIIASGSLLGIALHQGTSFPVGQVNFLHLNPMDFEEFLIANGQEKIVKLYKDDPNQIFDKRLNEYMKYYFITGGMPEVVKSRIEEQSMEKVEEIQESILQSYRFDFSKHTNESTTKRLLQIRESIPLQFAKKNDKFTRGIIKEGARAKDYEIALQRLVDAGLVKKTNRVKSGDKIPLRAYSESNAFKLYFLDVGLLKKMAKIPNSLLLNKSSLFNEFNGLFAEQFVIQNLNGHECFYRTSNGTAEVDFICQIGEDIIPIEVKSGENTKSKSLKTYREKYTPQKAIRFSLLKYKEQEGLINIPLYLIFCFNKIAGEKDEKM